MAIRAEARWAAAHRPSGNALALVALGTALLLLYAPMLWQLQRQYWPQPALSHGPLVLLAVVGLLLAASLRQHRLGLPVQPRPGAGLALLAVGLLAHGLGSLFVTVQLSVLSLAPLLAGISLTLGGTALLRAQSFGLGFLLFLVPWPDWMTDPLMQPLKLAVSGSAEQLLHGLGYPVARQGVMLNVGPYRLLVEDACAGMNSLFMLEAFGLLYLHVLRHDSAWRNGLLALLIVPVSFASNVARVLVLALLTVHAGDAVAQGFMHECSGLLLFLAALLLLAPLDAALRRITLRLPA